MYSLNNSVTFNGKSIVTEEFLNQMVEALDITIYRHPRERLHKMESETIEKIGCAYLNLIRYKHMR